MLMKGVCGSNKPDVREQRQMLHTHGPFDNYVLWSMRERTVSVLLHFNGRFEG